jgi:hypothetical protein
MESINLIYILKIIPKPALKNNTEINIHKRPGKQISKSLQNTQNFINIYFMKKILCLFYCILCSYKFNQYQFPL